MSRRNYSKGPDRNQAAAMSRDEEHERLSLARTYVHGVRVETHAERIARLDAADAADRAAAERRLAKARANSELTYGPPK